MHWVALGIAGLLEVCWSVGLKYSCGFTKWIPSAVTVAAMAGSILLLGYSLRALPLGTAYAVWTGIGTIGAAAAGILLFGEEISFLRILFICLIVCGIAGLKWVAHN